MAADRNTETSNSTSDLPPEFLETQRANRKRFWRELTHELYRFVWPEHFLGKLSGLLGALSILSLAREAVKFGLVAPMRIMIEYYNRFIDSVFEIFGVQLLVDWLVRYIGSIFHIQFSVQPYWKHVLVLMLFYIFRDADFVRRRGLKIIARVHFVAGILIAATASLMAAVDFAPLVGDWHELYVAAVPILGFFLYSIASATIRGAAGSILQWNSSQPIGAELAARDLSWRKFLYKLNGAAGRAVGGLGVVSLLIISNFLGWSNRPGVVAILIYLLLFAMYWLVIGAFAVKKERQPGESWISAYKRTGGAQVGMAMLGPFYWFTIFLILNSGLGGFGL